MKVVLVHSAADPVRLGFAHIFSKREGMTNADGSKSKDKYEATFILQPGGENIKKVQAAIAQVAAEKYGTDLVQMTDDDGNNVGAPIPNWEAIYKEFADDQKGLRKGNLKKTEAGEIYGGFEGMMYVTAKNEARPGVYTLANTPAAAGDEGAPYAGCYVHGEIDIWALAKQGVKKRIVVDLLGLRKAADGDAFSAGSPPSKADAFANLSVEGLEDSSSGTAATGSAFD